MERVSKHKLGRKLAKKREIGFLKAKSLYGSDLSRFEAFKSIFGS
jgi:hypothetical protein